MISKVSTATIAATAAIFLAAAPAMAAPPAPGQAGGFHRGGGGHGGHHGGGHRGGWRHHGGWHGHRGGWHHRGGNFGAGLAGFAAGALLGGAVASEPYYYDEPGYSYRPEYGPSVEWCIQHYRSYDVRTQTYLGYDGERHPCP